MELYGWMQAKSELEFTREVQGEGHLKVVKED